MSYSPDAQRRYQDNNCVIVTLKLQVRQDSDIIRRLNASGNKSGYIKRLIREDISREPGTADDTSAEGVENG